MCFTNFVYLVKGVCVGNVVDDDGDGGISDVGRNERSETLLSGSVPQLKADGPVLQVHRFGQKVDADSSLKSIKKSCLNVEVKTTLCQFNVELFRNC